MQLERTWFDGDMLGYAAPSNHGQARAEGMT